MSRGFLMGAGWGTLVAGFGLVVASQVTDVVPVVVETVPPAVVAPNAPEAPVAAVDPILPSFSAAPPAEPVSEAPAQIADPDVVPSASAVAPEVTVPAEAPQPADPLPEAQTVILAPTVPAKAGTAPSLPQSGGDAPAFAAAVSAAVPLPEASATDAPPAADTAPAEVPPAVASAPELPAPELPAPPAAEPIAPETPAAPEAGPAGQTAPGLRPSPGFASKAVDGVKTGRLPAIEGAAEAPAEKAAEVVLIDDPDAAPIDQFAAAFDNPSDKPLFAVLLQDTGGPDIDREALAALPFPVSFVIDPTQPDAATAAQIYRAQGKEVLMLATGIPAGATASDLAVSMEASTQILAEAVGIVDLENGGFQGNRTLATQVLALVRDQGRGVLTWDRGLNAASQVAQREGMRHAVIFRSLDNEGEGTPLIRRYLDRAAFKAAQDGRVVVAGKTRPETVAALLEWAVEGRAETVALAPSTAVMTAP